MTNATTTKTRKSHTERRAEQAAKTTPGDTYLPALAKERETQRKHSQRIARGLMARLVRHTPENEGKNPSHYATGDGETVQPTRPGSHDHAKYKSHGYFC